MKRAKMEGKWKVVQQGAFLVCLFMLLWSTGFGKASVEDSLYLDLVDSVIVDLSRMGDIHPALRYVDLKDKQVYRHPEGIQTRISTQYNARGLPRTDYYTIMDLMFELHPADHGHEEAGKPLSRYWEREMGADADWQLGRLSVELRVSGKGNESLVKRVMEAAEKRFQPFREANGLPGPFHAEEALPDKEYNAAEAIFYRLLQLSLNDKPVERVDLQKSRYEQHEEWRLGMAWLEGGSHRFNLELTMMKQQPPKKEFGDLREAGSFRFRMIRRERLKISVNVASDENGPLGASIADILDRYLGEFE